MFYFKKRDWARAYARRINHKYRAVDLGPGAPEGKRWAVVVLKRSYEVSRRA